MYLKIRCLLIHNWRGVLSTTQRPIWIVQFQPDLDIQWEPIKQQPPPPPKPAVYQKLNCACTKLNCCWSAFKHSAASKCLYTHCDLTSVHLGTHHETKARWGLPAAVRGKQRIQEMVVTLTSVCQIKAEGSEMWTQKTDVRVCTECDRSAELLLFQGQKDRWQKSLSNTTRTHTLSGPDVKLCNARDNKKAGHVADVGSPGGTVEVGWARSLKALPN